MHRLSVIIPVYRNGMQARQTLDALFACRLPTNVSMEVLLVDDASDEGSDAWLAGTAPEFNGVHVQIVRNPVNVGRAATRNIGARAAAGEHLLFLDADCVPADTELLVHHLAALQSADVSIGMVTGDLRGFWHDYQSAASQRRATRMQEHPALRLTAANVMLRRQVFFDGGGFDERYRGYGFEDRALGMALEQRGARFAVSERAQVRHEDHLTLETVCGKLYAAARNGGPFSEMFPEAYRQLGYSAVDARLHPWLRMLSGIFEPLRMALMRWLSPRLDTSRFPLAWRLRLVRWLCAASYLRGSVEAASFKKSA